jgi:hypothetical protein
MASDVRFVALTGFDDGRCRWVDFETWWNAPVIWDANDRKFTRREIVMAVAENDGGAHVDPSLPAAYHALSRNNSMKMVAHSVDKTWDLAGPELPTVRQIGHEVLRTIHQHGELGT